MNGFNRKTSSTSTRATHQVKRWPPALVAVLVGLTFGLGQSQWSYALTGDADEPIVIRADKNQFDRKANRATYTGDVQVDQGTMRVNADRLVIDLEDNKVKRITSYGKPAKYQQQLNAGEDKVHAHAQTIVYHTALERLNLEGKAFLTQSGNEVSGETIVYDIVAGKIDTESSPDSGPVNMVFQPQRDKPSADTPTPGPQ